MEVHRFHDPKSYQRRIQPLLDRNPGKYNVMRSVLNTIITGDVYKTFYLLAVTDQGKVIAAAVWTPPHPVQVTELPESAIQPLAEALAQCEDAATAVGGPMPSVDSFATRWAELRRLAVAKRWDQGVFQLDEVAPLEPAEGCLRYATYLDLDLLTAWNLAFQQDAFSSSNPEAARRSAERAVKNRTAFFWTVGRERVSMAGAQFVSANDRRIGPVYTPEIHRGKGYATALVWTLSRAILDAGNKHCYLYTDFANKTANAIYRRIGYQQIGEAAHIEFRAAVGS